MRYCIIIIILLIQVVLFAQNTERESFTHLTIKDGLSQSSVKCLNQDYQGFIWAGTADGLNKFDGSQFVTYQLNPLNPHSIRGNDISCIYESPFDSILYIGTQDAGLAIYNRALNNFVSFDKKGKYTQPSLPTYIKDLLATSDTTLWVGTQNNGLYTYNPQDSSFVQMKFSEQINFSQINCLEKDRQGNIWIGTPYGLYVIKKNTFKNGQEPKKVLFNKSSSPWITALKTDVRGNIWVGTRNEGLHKYQPITGELETYMISWKTDINNAYVVNDIIQTTYGDIWIATNRGLLKFTESKNEFEIFQSNRNNQESLNNNNIYSLLEDRSGILWAGTFTGGINKLDPFRFRFSKYTNFPAFPSQENPNIHSVHVDHMKRIWLGTAKGLLEMTSNGPGNLPPSNQTRLHLKNKYVGAITSTPNNLVISCDGILLMSFDGRKIMNLSKIIEKKTGEQASGFLSSFTDVKGNIWLTTIKGLLKYSPDENTFHFYNPLDSEGVEKTTMFSCITEDFSGKIWLGTYGNQLYNFDVHLEKFKQFSPHEKEKELIIFDKIFSVCESSPGLLFIGTNMGLYSINYDDRSIKRYLPTDGLPNNNVYAVVPDKQGKVWCSTNAGITSFNPATKIFQSYTHEDGLQSDEFNEGAYYKDNNGTIYMGGIEGLNIFTPGNIKRNNYIPPVIITKMEIQYKKVTPQTFPQLLDKQISETEKIILNHKDNTFSFEFSALSYSLYNRNLYKFALTENGKEDKWIDAGNQQTATYTNLSPGHYVFKVKGSNSDGVWNETPATIGIDITPPFWQSWWFRSAAILFLLGSPLLIIFLRIKSIKMQRLNLQKLVKEKTEQIKIQNQKLISVNNNIRQKNQQHHQIITQHNLLLEKAKKTEAASMAKINLFTNISHDVRAPLTLILEPLKDLLSKLDKTEKNEIKRKLNNIHISASKLLTIINQLLEFRKAESVKMQLAVANIDLIQFTQERALLFNDLAKQKKFNFSFSSSYNKLKIWADSDKLEKIIFNLVLNAFNFTPEKGTITIKVSTIKKQNSIYASLSIRDTGYGIHKSKLPYIFKKFYQSYPSERADQQGSGLGLAIVSKYIEMLKGDITVTSTIGEGSEFLVMLPLGRRHFNKDVKFDLAATSVSDSLKATISDYIPVSNRDFPKFDYKEKSTILLIENNANLRSYLKESLSRKYNIIEASNAKDGLELINSNHTDLIVCDVFLSGISGLKVCREIKSNEKTCHLPVIMLTSAADQYNLMKSLESGADNSINKPFDLLHLVVAIENLIENRKKIKKKARLNIPDNNLSNAISAKDQRFLNEVVKCIEENLTNSSFSVDSLCSQIGISQSNCYRKIKGLTGINISEFIRNTRLQKASELLEQKNYKISEVAYETGFNDPNYFTKSFTKFYGITPSEYANL